MKTDLSKILSISGQSGLFLYIAQAKSGIVVESIVNKKRSSFGVQSKITSLSDVAIYTDEGEVKLKEVFLKMKDALGEDSISSKAGADELKKLFGKALPDYDRDRFYVSHMKKVADWYNCLREYASLDFEDDDKSEEEQPAEE